MKVSFYSESPDPGPGGAEQFIAVLAEAMSHDHEVCIVHHKESLQLRVLEEYSGCDLSRVTHRYVPMERDESHRQRTPWSRYLAARAWRRVLSEGSDVFIAMLHNKAPICRARTGILVVLFPTYDPALQLIEPPAKPKPKKSKKKKQPEKPKKKKDPADIGRAGMFAWRWLHRRYCQWEWRRRMAGYQVRLSISEFTRAWTTTRWGIESGLLYPPVRLPETVNEAKEPLVLSVGRFATTGHTKKQRETVAAFRELLPSLPGSWQYACVGGLNDSPQDIAYFEEVRAMAQPGAIEVRSNIGRDHLQSLYSRAAIFWHAAGFGDDHSAQPELAEHFGLTTVEAMAAGCVPVVINKGGQPEIVEHGVSGFVWDTLEELKQHTARLAHDPALLRRMSLAARERAKKFSREASVSTLLEALGLKITSAT
jgi:L-malate glycosyltransferase